MVIKYDQTAGCGIKWGKLQIVALHVLFARNFDSLCLEYSYLSLASFCFVKHVVGSFFSFLATLVTRNCNTPTLIYL